MKRKETKALTLPGGLEKIKKEDASKKTQPVASSVKVFKTSGSEKKRGSTIKPREGKSLGSFEPSRVEKLEKKLSKEIDDLKKWIQNLEGEIELLKERVK
jgi:predicted  nucleic acid-binding Zn-ribbon protein